MRSKGFTLIELLAVIVILAILALITVPIVLKLVENARKDSAIRSAENYLDAVKKTVMNDTINSEIEIEECYILQDGNLKCNGDVQLTVDVDGKKPTDGKISFFGDTVGEVLDIRIGKYYISSKDKGLVASTKKSQNGNGNEKEYKKGNIIYVKSIPFYVIKDSSSNENYVVAIKTVPLTVDQLNKYGRNIINRYKNNEAYVGYCYYNQQEVQIGLMAYYNDEDCGYVNGYAHDSGCSNLYDESDVKKVVDNWANSIFKNNELKLVNGYKARLITYEELTKNIRYNYDNTSDPFWRGKANSAPDELQWIYGDYTYWTMTPYYDYDNVIWFVSRDHLIYLGIDSGGNIGGVRPVVNVYKSSIDSHD